MCTIVAGIWNFELHVFCKQRQVSEGMWTEGLDLWSDTVSSSSSCFWTGSCVLRVIKLDIMQKESGKLALPDWATHAWNCVCECVCAHDSHVYHEWIFFYIYSIDASVDDGSLGRLVNDDSNPNAKVKVISISRIPHLCLFALRDIQSGEEITYDYGGYDLPWRRGTVSAD